MKAIIFDTETTGLESPECIELAYAFVEEGLWGLSEIQEERFLNSKPIEWGALATHHILPSMLESCRPSSEAALPQCSYLIGHNVDFDWKVMGKPPIRRIDTLAMCRNLFPKADSHKLGAMYYYLFGAHEASRKDLRDAHSAAADVYLCARILKELAGNLGLKTFEAIWRFSEEARIPFTMPFGKHKGKPIAEVDKGWRKWYAAQADTDPYILMAFARYPA